ncbi:MAG TPA: protease inhibitor I42 family protein [Candidatus Baltobacteraceae bacterium]|nr:protease inhibitor I42 family protein [Candidatus Baltobacteraceae bacterium]
MNRALITLAAAALLALTPHAQVILERDASAPVTIQAGEDFFIALPSNASTGYSWSQTIASGRIVAYEGALQQAASNDMPGAPGQQIFIFHANRAGSTTILFAYARPWEHGPSAKTLSFTIDVR